MPCGFTKFGCSAVMVKVEMKEHEKTCHYRSIPCLISGCKVLYPISSYMDHLKEKHRTGELISQSGSKISLQTDYIGKFRKERERHPNNVLRKVRYWNLEYDGNQFLVEIKATQSEQEFEHGTAFVTFHTRILTAGEAAKRYRVFIRVFNASKVSANFKKRIRL